MTDTIYIGDYAIRPFALQNADGTPYDLTGHNVQYHVEREGEPSADVWAYDSATNPAVVAVNADPTTGLVEVRLFDVTYLSATLTDAALYYEQLRIYDSGGKPVVAIRQQFIARRAL